MVNSHVAKLEMLVLSKKWTSLFFQKVPYDNNFWPISFWDWNGFPGNCRKICDGFSSCIKDFENAAFSHSTAVPNKYAILFKNTFFVIYKNFSWWLWKWKFDYVWKLSLVLSHCWSYWDHTWQSYYFQFKVFWSWFLGDKNFLLGVWKCDAFIY